MRLRWPRLISLNVPILHTLDDGSGAKGIDGHTTFRGRVPEYDLWIPGLKWWFGMSATAKESLTTDVAITES